MLCCGACFGDVGLRKNLIPQKSTQTGDCPTCGTPQQPLVEARTLRDFFELVISIYVFDTAGRPLLDWLTEDWRLFKHPGITRAKAHALLSDILATEGIGGHAYSPSLDFETDSLKRWEELRYELMHRNRFFPQAEFDADRFGNLVSNLIFDGEGAPGRWYRARIVPDGKHFTAYEMGAPPLNVASHGRANPAGIPYLYLGSTEKTAVAEVRPYPGERVCVAKYTTHGSLKIVDLRSPRDLISPFMMEDEEQVGLLRGDIGFLEKLGTELTTPVIQSAAAINYVPSQYLCELIKTFGYDGVLYGSSVGSGMNQALFNPDKATAEAKVENYIIKSVEVDMRPAPSEPRRRWRRMDRSR